MYETGRNNACKGETLNLRGLVVFEYSSLYHGILCCVNTPSIPRAGYISGIHAMFSSCDYRTADFF